MKYSEEYKQMFKQRYGEGKFKKVEGSIRYSRHTSTFIENSIRQRFVPPGRSFVECVMSNLKYSFSSAEKIHVASLVLLDIWYDRVENQSFLPIAFHQVSIEKEIFKTCNAL